MTLVRRWWNNNNGSECFLAKWLPREFAGVQRLLKSARKQPPPCHRKAQKHGGGAVGAEKFFKSHLPERNSFRWGGQPTADRNPRRSEPHSSEGASPNGPLLSLVDSQYSSNRSPSGESVPQEGDEAAGGGVDHRRATSASSAAVAPESSSKSRGASGDDLEKELESPSAAGRGGVIQQTAAAAAAPAATAGGRDEEGAIPRNVSMEESVGTNPLYKTVAPYSRSTNESQSVSYSSWSRRALAACTSSKHSACVFFSLVGRSARMMLLKEDTNTQGVRDYGLWKRVPFLSAPRRRCIDWPAPLVRSMVFTEPHAHTHTRLAVVFLSLLFWPCPCICDLNACLSFLHVCAFC